MDEKVRAAIERLKQNKALAEQIMRSGDGQKLMGLLTKGNGSEALDRAARSAASGDTQELAQMLRKLMLDPDGAAVMSRLNDSAKQ